MKKIVVFFATMGIVIGSLTGCVTPGGTYSVDTVQAAQVLMLISQVLEIAQAQGLLPPPGEQLEPQEIDYKQRLMELLFQAIARQIENVDLNDLVNKAKVN